MRLRCGRIAAGGEPLPYRFFCEAGEVVVRWKVWGDWAVVTVQCRGVVYCREGLYVLPTLCAEVVWKF